MLKNMKQRGLGIRDPTKTVYARKIKTLEKIITKDRKPWMRCVELKLNRTTAARKVK